MEKERRTKALLLSTLIVVVATLSIAFAAMSRTLNINGIGKMDTASWSVYFDNLSNAKITRGAQQISAPKISDDKGIVQDINVKLSNPRDEISYTVDIVNDGTIDAEITMIKDIELTDVQKKVFEFKVTYTDTGEVLKDGDLLPAGDTKNITINIKFKDDITEFDLPTESQTINLSYQITYTQYDGDIENSGSSGEQPDDEYKEQPTYEYVKNENLTSFMARPMYLANIKKSSSIISAGTEGNVFANSTVRIPILTKDNVEQIKVTNITDGTEVIWTKETSTVTDNGDGTSRWEYKYKFSEGEFKFVADAMVNGEYENSPAEFPITATTKSVKLTYTVVGVGKTTMQHDGSSVNKNSTYKSTTVPYGSIVTLTALTSVENCQFYYWIDNTYDHIFSDSKTIKYIAYSSKDLVAEFTLGSSHNEGKKNIVYLDKDDIIVERFELASGESYTTPAAPTVEGYTFTGWSMSKSEVLNSTEDTILVKAQYTKNNSDTITVNGGSYNASSSGGDFVDVVAPLTKDGKEFSYWIDSNTNTILAYSNEATILVKGQMTLTPIYGVENIEVTPLVNVIQTEYNSTNKTLRLWTNYWIPEEYQEVERGFIVEQKNYWYFYEGYGVISGINSGGSYNIKAYVLYADENGELHYVYSPEFSYTAP